MCFISFTGGPGWRSACSGSAKYLRAWNVDLNIPKLGSIMPKMGIPKKRVLRARRQQSLADALFSTTQQRVLALLFGQPGRSFYATELIGLTSAGSGAVQRELARLEQSGLVTVRRLGAQKHYQANPDSPLFAELCSIMRKTVAVAEPLKEVLAPLAPAYRRGVCLWVGREGRRHCFQRCRPDHYQRRRDVCRCIRSFGADQHGASGAPSTRRCIPGANLPNASKATTRS